MLRGNDLDVYAEVLAGRYFDLQFKADRLVVSAAGYVGYITLNDRVAIEVRPRVPIANLERVFAVGKGQPLQLRRHTRRYASHDESAPSLLDTLAEALADSVSVIETSGLHRDYVRRVDDSGAPRGRILVSRTIQQLEARGIRHRVVSSWFESTVDTAPNRCLKYALWTVLQRYSSIRQLTRVRLELLRRLNLALRVFDGVRLDGGREWLNDPRVSQPGTMPAIRSYYEDALRLAVAIVTEQGIRFRDQGELALPSQLLDMANLFESYVREVLRRHLRQAPGTYRVLDGNQKPPTGGSKMLFDEPSNDITPDVVVLAGASAERTVVVEVKYKPLEGKPDRLDTYQAITYGTSYRAKAVVLVQPTKSPANAGLHNLGTIGTLSVLAYGVDLSSTDLRATEHNLGRAIEGLMS